MYFFDGNRERYCRLYFAQQVTRNMDSNYDPIDGRKNGNLMFCSRIFPGNIFPISRRESSQNLVLGKKDVGGKSFTSLDRFENVLKSDLRPLFQP